MTSIHQYGTRRADDADDIFWLRIITSNMVPDQYITMDQKVGMTLLISVSSISLASERTHLIQILKLAM